MPSFLRLGYGHRGLCISLGVSGAWLTQHIGLRWGARQRGGGQLFPV